MYPSVVATPGITQSVFLLTNWRGHWVCVFPNYVLLVHPRQHLAAPVCVFDALLQ